MSLGEYNAFGDTFGLSNLLFNIHCCNRHRSLLKTKTVCQLRPINLPSHHHHHQHHLFQAQRNFCAFFAINNNVKESVYRSHVLKDGDGRTSCPYLRAYTCPICKANGDNSHTLKYCPMNQNPGLFPRPERKQQQQQQQPIHRPDFRPFPPPPRLPNMSMGNQFPNFQRNENSLFFNNWELFVRFDFTKSFFIVKNSAFFSRYLLDCTKYFKVMRNFLYLFFSEFEYYCVK